MHEALQSTALIAQFLEQLLNRGRDSQYFRSSTYFEINHMSSDLSALNRSRRFIIKALNSLPDSTLARSKHPSLREERTIGCEVRTLRQQGLLCSLVASNCCRKRWSIGRACQMPCKYMHPLWLGNWRTWYRWTRSPCKQAVRSLSIHFLPSQDPAKRNLRIIDYKCKKQDLN